MISYQSPTDGYMPLFRKSIKKVERKEAQEALNHALQLDDTTALREAISPAESVVGVTPDEREKAKQKLRELEEEVDAATPPPLPLDSLDDEQYRRKAAVKHVVGALKTAKRTSHRRDSIEALKGAIELAASIGVGEHELHDLVHQEVEAEVEAKEKAEEEKATVGGASEKEAQRIAEEEAAAAKAEDEDESQRIAEEEAAAAKAEEAGDGASSPAADAKKAKKKTKKSDRVFNTVVSQRALRTAMRNVNRSGGAEILRGAIREAERNGIAAQEISEATERLEKAVKEQPIVKDKKSSKGSPTKSAASPSSPRSSPRKQLSREPSRRGSKLGSGENKLRREEWSRRLNLEVIAAKMQEASITRTPSRANVIAGGSKSKKGQAKKRSAPRSRYDAEGSIAAMKSPAESAKKGTSI